MDKKTFIQQYMLIFLAAHAAQGYDMACLAGTEIKPEVEDAAYLAEQAFEAIQKYLS